MYLIMEFCSGGDVSKFIQKNGRLTEEQAGLLLSLVVACCFTLPERFASRKNHMHRDPFGAHINIFPSTREMSLAQAQLLVLVLTTYVPLRVSYCT